MGVLCTLVVNIWHVSTAQHPQATVQAEAMCEDVEFASVPASGDRLRAGALGVSMESLMGLATVDRVEHAPKLPFNEGWPRAKTVVVVNLTMVRDITPEEADQISSAGWTLVLR